MKILLIMALVAVLYFQGKVVGQDVSSRSSQADQAEELIHTLATNHRARHKLEALKLLLGNREKNLPYLRQAARSGGRSTRMMAIRLLAEIRDPQAAALAFEGLGAENVAIRRRAATALKILEGQVPLPRIAALLPVERDLGTLKSLIVAIGASGQAEAADVLRPYLSHADQSVRVNTAISLARIGSTEGFAEILAGLESRIDMPACREATYGLGFFAGEERRASKAAQSIINDPRGVWKGEAGISLLRLELTHAPDKLMLLSKAASTGHRLVRNWAIGEIAAMGNPKAFAWLQGKAGDNDAFGRLAAFKLLMKGGKDVEKK